MRREDNKQKQTNQDRVVDQFSARAARLASHSSARFSVVNEACIHALPYSLPEACGRTFFYCDSANASTMRSAVRPSQSGGTRADFCEVAPSSAAKAALTTLCGSVPTI